MHRMMCFAAIACAACMGCANSDKTCDVDTFNASCINNTEMETCTINEEIVIVRCPATYQCVEMTTADGSSSAECKKSE